MNIKTKYLMDKDNLEILLMKLEYQKVIINSMNMVKFYENKPKRLLDFIHNQVISIKYNLLADGDELYMFVTKKGIHLNGNYDYKELEIVDENAEVLYFKEEINAVKTKKKKR